MPLLGDGSIVSVVVFGTYDSIRCRMQNGGYRGDQGESGDKAKKCGVESGDPNLRFQPRLPGSVVGEASMRQVEEADKITGVTVLW
jgi:hypothetical protein